MVKDAVGSDMRAGGQWLIRLAANTGIRPPTMATKIPPALGRPEFGDHRRRAIRAGANSTGLDVDPDRLTPLVMVKLDRENPPGPAATTA